MKKVLPIVLLVFTFIANVNNTYAIDSTLVTDTGVCTEDTDVALSSEEISEMNKKINDTINLIDPNEDYLGTESGIIPYATYVDYNYFITVSNYTQETSYYCGPASVRQSLSFHKSNGNISTSLPSQSTLASKIGTTTSGSASSSMATALNAYKSTFKIPQSYVAVDILDKSDPDGFLAEALKNMLSNKYTAPIILIDTGNNYGISQYKGVYIRHYNTVSGLTEKVNIQNGEVASRKVRRVDPHYSSTYRGVFTNDFAEVYQAVKQADQNGANKVLIY